MTREMMRKIMIIFILFAVLISGASIKSFAAEEEYTCTLTIDPDKTKIAAGESVTFSIKVSDINAGNGIAIFNTTLEYDTNVFDIKLKPDDAGVWTIAKVEDLLIFTKVGYEATTQDQEIGKIELTAKQDVELGKQTITFKKNEFSDKTGFLVPDITKTIEIVKESTGGDKPAPENPGNNTSGGNTNTPSGGNTNTPSGGNTNTPSGGSTNKPSGGSANKPSGSVTGSSGSINSGKSDTTLPKTGVQEYLIGAIVVAVIVAIGFYIKYKRAY